MAYGGWDETSNLGISPRYLPKRIYAIIDIKYLYTVMSTIELSIRSIEVVDSVIE